MAYSAIDLITRIINNTIGIAYGVYNSTLYDPDKFAEIEVHIQIWQAVSQRLLDEKVRTTIRDVDLIVFAKGAEELHHLMREYAVRKCDPNTIPELHSADELIHKLNEEKAFMNLSDREKEQSLAFWMDLKQENGLLISSQAGDNDLVTEIVLWGTRLDRFSAAVFPSMFHPFGTDDEDFASFFVSIRLTELNLRGQVMSVQSVPSTERCFCGFLLDEPGQFELEFNTLASRGRDGIPNQLIRPPTPSTKTTEQDVAREQANRTDLGGKERRQWATFTRDGNESTVIVELTAKPTGLQAGRFRSSKDLAAEANKLVRMLRVASRSKEKDRENHPFHVLYSEGWYDHPDHFGLVYRLPALKTSNFRCESLENILLKEEYRKLLAMKENRLVLATTLAWTLFELHSVNWVHDSFDPDNILLFAEEIEPGACQFDWSSPFIVGFGSSLTGDGCSAEFKSKPSWTSPIYAHPESVPSQMEQLTKRFKKTYDIYSLGVVLLEIGRLRSFIAEPIGQQKVMKDLLIEFTYEKQKAADSKDGFVKEAEVLKGILGLAYQEVVMTCLNWDVVHAENDNKLSGLFRSQVCEKLALIKIS